MSVQPAAYPNQDSLMTVLKSIAQWISRYREANALRNQLMACSPEEVARMASDMGITSNQLATLARKGPHAADLLQKLLVALGVDAEGLALDDPMIMRDLQRLCTTCGYKRQCALDVEAGTIACNFRDYCPNSFTLDALIKPNQ